jgi:phosphoribosylaminoimidazole-succinocarboxamide synthase
MTASSIELPGFTKIRSGKVREIFDLGDSLLFVASDRISAFDVVLPDPIPDKGAVLTQMSAFWFRRFDFVRHHMISADAAEFPGALQGSRDRLAGRSMIVRKAAPLPVECIVRGYLAGSGWKEYRETGSVAGIGLPSGLRQADCLPQPIFTPSTKAATGHDVNIDWATCVRLVGSSIAEEIRDLSLRIYEEGREHAAKHGILIADTKFEFGVEDGRVILIDECLTPDSSRFWPADQYAPGSSPPSFDKQYVRDYLETLDWDKTPPGPTLPPEIVGRTRSKYLEAFSRLTGSDLVGPGN